MFIVYFIKQQMKVLERMLLII